MPAKTDKIRLSRSEDRRAKLTDEQIVEAVDMYRNGFTQKEIAVKMGVCQSTIGYIVSEKSKETLKEYRKINPPMRRTRAESTRYMRNLREYKKDVNLARRKKMSNLQRDVWKGWTPQDFIDSLEVEIRMIMNGDSWRKPFTTQPEMINYIKENQPYYKKSIPEVNEYFVNFYGLK